MWTAPPPPAAAHQFVRSSFGVVEINRSFLRLLAARESRSLTEEPGHLARRL